MRLPLLKKQTMQPAIPRQLRNPPRPHPPRHQHGVQKQNQSRLLRGTHHNPSAKQAETDKTTKLGMG